MNALLFAPLSAMKSYFLIKKVLETLKGGNVYLLY